MPLRARRTTPLSKYLTRILRLKSKPLTLHLDYIKKEIASCAKDKNWMATDWQLFALRIENSIPYADFAQIHGRDEAYWRNRWRDKIKPVLERVRDRLEHSAI